MADNISNPSDELNNILSQMDTTVAANSNTTLVVTGGNPENTANGTDDNKDGQNTTQNTEQPQEVDNMDAYLDRFEQISSQNTELRQLLQKIINSEHDQARVAGLCKYILKLQDQLDTVYSQLVDMNNILGK